MLLRLFGAWSQDKAADGHAKQVGVLASDAYYPSLTHGVLFCTGSRTKNYFVHGVLLCTVYYFVQALDQESFNERHSLIMLIFTGERT